jgi:hypothetical protein
MAYEEAFEEQRIRYDSFYAYKVYLFVYCIQLIMV